METDVLGNFPDGREVHTFTLMNASDAHATVIDLMASAVSFSLADRKGYSDSMKDVLHPPVTCTPGGEHRHATISESS